MTELAQPVKPSSTLRRWQIVRIVLFSILAIAVVPVLPRVWQAAQHIGFHPHPPKAALWLSLPIQIKLHIAAAVSAFVIGTVQMIAPKGVGLHKVLGWAWVVAMGVTAVSSFFITGLNGNFWSLIHILSGWTVVALPMAIYAIRNQKVVMHQRMMTGLFFGGMLVAGALAFLPGRVMYSMFFG